MLVLRLKTVGTVEERVVGVASEKAQLADRSITGAAQLCVGGTPTSPGKVNHCSPRLPSAFLLLFRSRTGGFFDGSTSAKERQRYLLDTIRASSQAGSGARQDTSGQLSDDELNRLLARGDAELELFEAEDRRMRVGASG